MRYVSALLGAVVSFGLAAMVLPNPDSSRTSALEFNQADVAGVEAAVLDYVEGLYDVKPERIAKSVSRDLVKFGFWRRSDADEYRGSPMTYDQLYDLASKWNLNNKMKLDSDTPKEIKVLDVLDKTATAKLTAQWGVDYFQLEKSDDKWMIRHVLWQSHP